MPAIALRLLGLSLAMLLLPPPAAPGLFDGLRQSADGEGGAGQPVVQIRDGKLRGRRMASRMGRPFLAFLGVPYARPPLGDLRFRAPRPPVPWQGVRDATREGAMCLPAVPTKLLRRPGQTFGRNPLDFLITLAGRAPSGVPELAGRLPGLLPASSVSLLAADLTAVGVSEDCLWLNVFTPQTSLPASSLLPVFFNIHGGGFIAGTGSALVYGAEYLVDRGLVVVSLNYRLGILGFLSTNSSDAPGNAGLKDQSLALRWVRDNIAAFGGDPDRVTIYGESAGSMSVHYHLLSPMSRGLFSAGIMSSGAAQSDVIVPSPVQPSDQLVRRLAAFFGGPATGSPAELVRFLRSVPALPLCALVAEMITEADFRSLVPSLPSQGLAEPPSNELPFLPKDPRDLVAFGRHARVPLIIGSNFREGSLFFVARTESDVARVEREPTILLPDLVFHGLDEEGRRRAAQQVRDVYLGGQRADKDSLTAIVDVFGDVSLTHGVDLAARWHSRDMPVWRYHFTADPFLLLTQFLSMPANIKGPGHADDLAYVFYNRLLGDTHNAQQEYFEATLDRMQTLIANFCYYHDPVPNASAAWPRFRPGGRHYLDIGEQLAVRRDLWPERMALWTRLHREATGHPVYDPPA